MYDESLRPGLEEALKIVLDRFDVEYAHYQEMWKQGSTNENRMVRQENKLLTYNDVVVALTNRLLMLQ